MLKTLNCLLLVCMALVLVGCRGTMNLTYEPVLEKKDPCGVVIVVERCDPEVVAAAAKEQEERERKQILIAKYAFNPSAPEWVAQSLEIELSQAGYIVQPWSEIQDCTALPVYSLKSGILRCENKKMELEITIMQGSREILHKVYQSQSEMGCRLYQISRMNDFFAQWLQEILAQVVEDVNRAISQDLAVQ